MSSPDLRPLLDYYEVQYRDREGNQLIRCPVHPEDRPSCSLNLSKGLWRCFHESDCGGDGYTLVQLLDHCEFKEAAEKVEQLTGHKVAQREEVKKPRSVFRRGEGYKPKVRGSVFR